MKLKYVLGVVGAGAVAFAGVHALADDDGGKHELAALEPSTTVFPGLPPLGTPAADESPTAAVPTSVPRSNSPTSATSAPAGRSATTVPATTAVPVSQHSDVTVATTSTTAVPSTTSTTQRPVLYTCRLSVSPGAPAAGQKVSASIYVEPNSHTNRNVPVTIRVEGRPDVSISGATNDQGYFTGSFTANAGDPGGVTAEMYRSGVSAGTCSASYAVS